MNREQFLLTKLAEEAVEIAHMALKTQQFGMEECRRGDYNSNRLRLHDEINDMLAIITMLNEEVEFEFTEDRVALNKKIIKVDKYYGYSVALGKIHEKS